MAVEAINSVKNVQLSKIQAQKPAFGQSGSQKQESEDKTGLIVTGLVAAAAIGAATVMIIKGKGSKVVKDAAQAGSNKPVNMAQEAAQASAGKGGNVAQETTAIAASKEQSAVQGVAQETTTVAEKTVADINVEKLSRYTQDELNAISSKKITELTQDEVDKLLNTIVPEDEILFRNVIESVTRNNADYKHDYSSVEEFVSGISDMRKFFAQQVGGEKYFKKLCGKDSPLLKNAGDLTVGDAVDCLPENLLREIIPETFTDRTQKLLDVSRMTDGGFHKSGLNFDKPIWEQVP